MIGQKRTCGALWMLLWSAALLPVADVAEARKGRGGAYDPEMVPGVAAFTSTYRAQKDVPTLIRNARVLTGTGDELERTDILISSGLVAKMGAGLKPPSGARVIDGTGKWVTPGLIDLGFGFALPESKEGIVWALPSLVDFRAEQVRALAGGVTTLLFNRIPVLSDRATSAFALGSVLRNVPDRDLQGTLFPGVRSVLTMHCPADAAGWRRLQQIWRSAASYLAADGEVNADLNLLAAVQKGDLPIYLNCSRMEALSLALSFADRNSIRYGAVLSASEGYKLARELNKKNLCTGFSVGQTDATGQSGNVNVLAAPLMQFAGGGKGCAMVQSGGTEDFGQLPLLAGRSRAQAEALGLRISPAQAMAWITRNPARVLGIADRVGTLRAGRVADVVLWSGNPFSVYSRAEKVFLDGVMVWDLQSGGRQFQLDEDIRARLELPTPEAAEPVIAGPVIPVTPAVPALAGVPVTGPALPVEPPSGTPSLQSPRPSVLPEPEAVTPEPEEEEPSPPARLPYDLLP